MSVLMTYYESGLNDVDASVCEYDNLSAKNRNDSSARGYSFYARPLRLNRRGFKQISVFNGTKLLYQSQ